MSIKPCITSILSAIPRIQQFDILSLCDETNSTVNILWNCRITWEKLHSNSRQKYIVNWPSCCSWINQIRNYGSRKRKKKTAFYIKSFHDFQRLPRKLKGSCFNDASINWFILHFPCKIHVNLYGIEGFDERPMQLSHNPNRSKINGKALKSQPTFFSFFLCVPKFECDSRSNVIYCFLMHTIVNICSSIHAKRERYFMLFIGNLQKSANWA